MPIRVAIVGVGNCASALIQGIAKAKDGSGLSGVTYGTIGGYAASDIDVITAFDVDVRKVGQPLSKAIFAAPNCCWEICDSSSPNLPACTVLLAPVMDGVAEHMKHAAASRSFRVSMDEPLTRSQIVEQAQKVDVLINYLPVGSLQATEFWAGVCLDAGVSFLNCIPVFIASDPVWEARFVEKGLPLIGDDMRSQFGASVLSQMLQELALDRGHTVKAHIQQNAGGNTDFLNMTDKTRLYSKKISKENVLRAQGELRNVRNQGFLFAGPSDYIEYYGDNKIATIRLELEGFGGAPVTLDARLSVQDSPNSAGVVIDAIRFLKVASEMGIKGSLRGASAFTQKTPPVQMLFAESKRECDALAKREFTRMTAKQI